MFNNYHLIIIMLLQKHNHRYLHRRLLTQTESPLPNMPIESHLKLTKRLLSNLPNHLFVVLKAQRHLHLAEKSIKMFVLKTTDIELLPMTTIRQHDFNRKLLQYVFSCSFLVYFFYIFHHEIYIIGLKFLFQLCRLIFFFLFR